MKTTRLTSLIRIMDSTARATQRLGMGKLPGLYRDRSLPADTRQAALDLTKMTASLISKGKICPISVADQMLEEIEQLQRDLREAEKTAQSLMQELEKRPDSDKLIEREKRIRELDQGLQEKEIALTDALAQSEEADKKVQDLTSHIKTLEEQLNQSREETKDKVNRLQSKILRVENLESRVKDLTGELEKIRTAKNAAEQRVQSLIEQLRQSENDLENAAQNTQSLSERLAQQQTELGQLRKNFREKEKSLKNANSQKEAANESTQKLKNSLRSHQTESAQLQNELKEARDQLEGMSREKDRIASAFQGLIAEGRRTLGEKADLEKRLIELAAEKQKLERVVEGQKKTLDDRNSINVNLSTVLKQTREEKEAAVRTARKLDSQLSVLRNKLAQTKKELSATHPEIAELKKSLNRFQNFQKIWERVDPEIIGQWLLLFSRIDNATKNKDEKKDKFFSIFAVVDHLLRTGASNIYTYMLNIDPEMRNELFERIAQPTPAVTRPAISAAPPLPEEERTAAFIKTTNLPVPNQLRLVSSQRMDPKTHAQIIQHLCQYNLGEARKLRSAEEKPVKDGADLVWRYWLRSILEYFSQNPQDEQRYAEHLAYLGEDLDGLKIFTKDQDENIRNMAKKVIRDAQPAEPKKRNWKVWQWRPGRKKS